MIAQGVGAKTGRRMGHVSMSGPDGAIARLRGVPVGRRIFIHVNNTNPALLADSAERAELERAGWEVAYRRHGAQPVIDARYGNLPSADELEAALREIGAERYHILHPFHRLLHTGKLDQGQVQAWALNRYYYQSRIPMKDAALLSRCEDRELRREWLVRLLDHDGMGEQEGGIARWLRLCQGLGLDPDYVRSEVGILPATKFAVDAYVRFVRERTLLEAVASSLTELFAPKIHEERIPGLLQHYSFVSEEMVAYFRRRLDQAPRDAGFALAYVREHADTPEKRARRRQGADLQVRRALGAARRAAPCLRAGRRRAHGRLRPERLRAGQGRGMSLDALSEADRVALPAWVRLHFDRVRDRWVLLAPERVLFPCATSVTILERLGEGRGARATWSTALADEFEAPRATISADVRQMLQGLADQGFLAVESGHG